jgi:cell division protein FtsW
MIETANQRSINRARPKKKKSVNLSIDIILLLTTITLVIFGLIMVYSASWDYSFRNTESESHTEMFFNQLKWLGVGLFIALIVYRMDYHNWRRLAVPAMMVIIGLLIAVLFIKEERYGAVRTINKGSFTPSEFAKLVTVIYLSVWLNSKRNLISKMKFGLIPLGGIIGVISGLILRQPDISAVATIMFLGGVLFFLAGADLKQISLFLLVAMVIGWGIVQVSDTAQDRIAFYFDGIKNPTMAHPHVRRAIESVVDGGLFGVGIGNGDTKLVSLPFPMTDSIFAVIAEETGLAGTTFLIGLFFVLIWRGLHISRQAPDMLGSLLAAGLTFWIGVEAFINMAMMVSLLPVAGNALPFISLGGSSLISTLVSIGILLNISRLSKMPEIQKERTGYASDGIRRSDRRGDQSRPRSSASSW